MCCLEQQEVKIIPGNFCFISGSGDALSKLAKLLSNVHVGQEAVSLNILLNDFKEIIK